MELVSVITPVFNMAHTLQRAFASLQAQAATRDDLSPTHSGPLTDPRRPLTDPLRRVTEPRP